MLVYSRVPNQNWNMANVVAGPECYLGAFQNHPESPGLFGAWLKMSYLIGCTKLVVSRLQHIKMC